jgi:hypothetical protein
LITAARADLADLPEAQGAFRGAPRASTQFREPPHVQFNYALIYSVGGFIQGGHFQV